MDYTRICPRLIDDVAKNHIERNRTIDGELWRLFEVGGTQVSTRVPLAGNSGKLGGLEKREIGAVQPSPELLRQASAAVLGCVNALQHGSTQASGDVRAERGQQS